MRDLFFENDKNQKEKCSATTEVRDLGLSIQREELDYIEWYVLYIKFVYVYLVECPNTVMHVELLR